MPKYQLNKLNGQDQDAILESMHKNDYFYSSTNEQLAKHFLSNFIDGPIFKMSFDDIRNQLIGQAPEPLVLPTEECKFFEFICKTYVDLVQLPSAVMLEYYRVATKDLQAIEDRLKDYEAQVKAIDEKDPSSKTEEDTYQLKLLFHYSKANKDAHQEILDFLYYRLKDYTVFNSTGRPWMAGIIYGGMPYSFRVISKQLDWKWLSDLSNKFSELYIEDYQQLKEWYDAKNESAFYDGVRKYLSQYRIVEKIKGMIKGNHRLQARSQVFSEAFEAYDRGNKYIFCSVIALQIEGLFSDYCLELGVDELSIRGSSLTEKVRIASTQNRRYQNFEYYAFRFPLIRNRVAHGNLITKNVADLADYLLLDLYDVCLSIISPTLPVNKVVSILRSWDHDRDNRKLQVKYCFYKELMIPPFYKLEDIRIDVMDKIIQRPFWDYLHQLINSGQSTLQKGVLKIVTSLKRFDINTSWCKEFLGYLIGVNTEGLDDSQFLEELEQFNEEE
jgi:hypothetical protein